MIKDFKEFISRGNVVELAVGLIMATYFGAIVKSMVDDIIMPPVGRLIAGIDFARLEWVIGERVNSKGATEEIAIKYGLFLNHVLTFFIVSIAVFIIARLYNNFLRKKRAEPAAGEQAPTSQEQLLMEIRDAIKELKQTDK